MGNSHIVYRMDCEECGAPRIGRKQENTVEPLRDECQICGSAQYALPSDNEQR